MTTTHAHQAKIDLDHLPRVHLANLPTPLQEMPRLREALGGPTVCPRILIKRDDLTGLAFGGNKVRKLEFLVADALRQTAFIEAEGEFIARGCSEVREAVVQFKNKSSSH